MAEEEETPAAEAPAEETTPVPEASTADVDAAVEPAADVAVAPEAAPAEEEPAAETEAPATVEPAAETTEPAPADPEAAEAPARDPDSPPAPAEDAAGDSTTAVAAEEPTTEPIPQIIEEADSATAAAEEPAVTVEAGATAEPDEAAPVAASGEAPPPEHEEEEEPAAAEPVNQRRESSSSDGEDGNGHFLRNFVRGVIADEIAMLKRPGSSGSGSAASVGIDPNSMDENYQDEEAEEQEEIEQDQEEVEVGADGKKGPPAKRASAAKGQAKKKAKSKAKAKVDAKGKTGARTSSSAKAAPGDPKAAGEDGEAGDGTATGGKAGEGEGAAGAPAPAFDLEKLRNEIREIVRDVWKDEVTVESKNEKQLLDILRLRDNEVIRAHEKVAELTGLLLAADKTLEAMKDQVKEAEREKDEVNSLKLQLHDRMVAARVTEQKANTIVDANTKRSNDLARDLELEKKRRQDERVKLESMVEQAKEDHRVEVMAYRRALSTEEAKVVTLQRESKEVRERLAEVQAAKPGMGSSSGLLGMTGSSKFFSGSSAASTARHKTKKGGKGQMKSIENIYTPLSTGSLPKISNNSGYGRF
ncbi:unnamed protein product [Amoebophrya sp. A120]|nr:unnamed protein product [Amoebophrya sp. A120]|eukprot:GSA120T00012936001.1